MARESELVIPDIRRAGDRRRVDQSVHMPVDGATGLGPSGRAAHAAPCPKRGWHEIVGNCGQLPELIRQVLLLEPEIKAISEKISTAKNASISGAVLPIRSRSEGALKLKEISYIHAEGFAAGELKHGPIALIDETVPVVVIAPSDSVLEKTVSNVQEVARTRRASRHDR